MVAESGTPDTLHGREYTQGIPYALPTDLDETNRLDFQHFVLRQAFQGNYLAPIGAPASILDVGCGTGRWAKEMAAIFPNTNVVGVDVKEPAADTQQATTPALDLRPPNYAFVAGNILEGIPFPDASFDFVHQRLLFFAIPADRWDFVIRELVRVTRPGGWIELAEGNFGGEPQGPVGQKIADAMLPALLKRGIDPRTSSQIGPMLQHAGLSNVRSRTERLPIGDWGGRLGKLVAADLLTINQAARPLLLAQGMSEQEWSHLDTNLRSEWDRMHSTWPFHIAYGQRA